MAMTKPHWQANKDGIISNEGSYILKPHGLSIVWGNDERYWKIPKTPAPGSEEPAELIQVSWLEVTGSVVLTPGKSYELSFVVALAPDAFGWRDIQAFLMAKVGKKGRYKWTRVKLQDQNGTKLTIPDETQKFIIEVPKEATDPNLHFGLYEVWSGKWKGGLKIYKAEVKLVN